MTESCHIDFETRSTVDLAKSNAYVYAAHRDTDIWCAQIAFGDEDPVLWVPGMPVPPRLIDHILEGGELVAWNAAFERLITREIAGPRYGWPIPADEQWRCVMVESYAMNLPGKLEKAGPALGLSDVKDQEGHRLMMQMAKPRRIEADGTIVWWDDEARRQRLYAYCAKDVIAERAAEKRLFRLIPEERKTWLLDLKMNDRGVYIDAELCTIAKRLAGEAMERLDAEMHAVTDGDVSACSNVGQLIKWLKANGVDTDTTKKDVVVELLANDNLPDAPRRALELRQAGSRTSTAKFGQMVELRHPDGRMRGNLQFGGAAQTFRWAGRNAQLQNLKRPDLKLADELAATILQGDLDWLETVFGDPMSALADAMRSAITAAPGRVLLDADFANIEGRVIAWLAGEETKLARFRAFDAGTGPDVYLTTAASIYNVPVAQALPYRQVGKVTELSMGFGGGPGALARMAVNYGLKIATVYDAVWAAADDERRERAVDGYKQRGKASGMSERGWLAGELIKLAWRGDHVQTEALWRGLEDAAIAAVQDPERGVHAHRSIKYRMVGSFLFCLLPSGRTLSYPYPRIEMKKVPWKNADGTQARKPGITFKSASASKASAQNTGQWKDKDFYGGLAAENVTQAMARDVMRDAMHRVEAAGFEVVLTVHDEILTETTPAGADLERFKAVMAEVPAWCPGLPIAVNGWVGERFRK